MIELAVCSFDWLVDSHEVQSNHKTLWLYCKICKALYRIQYSHFQVCIVTQFVISGVNEPKLCWLQARGCWLGLDFEPKNIGTCFSKITLAPISGTTMVLVIVWPISNVRTMYGICISKVRIWFGQQIPEHQLNRPRYEYRALWVS